MVDVCLRIPNVSKFSLSSQDKNFNIYLRNFHEKVKSYHCAKDHASPVVTLATLRTFAFLHSGCLLKVSQWVKIQPIFYLSNIYMRNFHEKVKNYHCAKDHASPVVTLATLRTFAFLYGGCLLKPMSQNSAYLLKTKILISVSETFMRR